MVLDVHVKHDILYTKDELKNKNSFVHNFDVSVIMPFYKKLEEFKKIFPSNHCFFSRNGIEIIIAMDECTELDSLLEFTNLYSDVNWKIIVNSNDHKWRNPAKAINVGIRHATKKYVLVCSPESQLASDVIYILRKMLFYYPDHFAIGFVYFKSYEDSDLYVESAPYGSMMVEKKHLLEITGYDESLLEWGGDDDNVRARLEMIGVKKLCVNNARMIHWEAKFDLANRRAKSNPINRPLSSMKSILYPNCHAANPICWGDDFNTVVFDWKNKPNVKQGILSYLESFPRYQLNIDDISGRFNRILLVQCYNEKQNLNKFFSENERYFDGIIFLDDDSEDGSYDSVDQNKILLKVQKKRNGFNDLVNRNILLKLASFFNTDWLAFLDVDEIIDSRHSDFSCSSIESVDNIAFHLVHLWNNPQSFNKDYPFSKNGIQIHYRMFRNIGYSQILTPKKALHFVVAPYLGNCVTCNVLILHGGHLERSKREDKFKFYNYEDKASDQTNYDHLLNHNASLGAVQDISKFHP